MIKQVKLGRRLGPFDDPPLNAKLYRFAYVHRLQKVFS